MPKVDSHNFTKITITKKLKKDFDEIKAHLVEQAGGRQVSQPEVMEWLISLGKKELNIS